MSNQTAKGKQQEKSRVRVSAVYLFGCLSGYCSLPFAV
jgi:hypothetical protein